MNKAMVSILGASLLAALVSCERPASDAAAAEKITALEKRVQTLEQRNNDLALKSRILSSAVGNPFGSPLDNFFNSPEFWENTYESGAADCAKRCINNLTSERKACEAMTDPAQRQQCFQDAVNRASNCQKQCSQTNPPPNP